MQENNLKIAIELPPESYAEKVVWNGLRQHNNEYVSSEGDRTFSFQARPFYERCGYEVFGTLDDYPQGYQRFFMRKSLKY